MKTLFIFNDGPYGSERTYSGLRLAGALAKRETNEVRAFLMGDAVLAAHVHQKVPTGFYNVEVMLGAIARHGGQVGLCGTCLDARGLRLNPAAERPTPQATALEVRVISQQPPGGRCALYTGYGQALAQHLGARLKVDLSAERDAHGMVSPPYGSTAARYSRRMA